MKKTLAVACIAAPMILIGFIAVESLKLAYPRHDAPAGTCEVEMQGLEVGTQFIAEGDADRKPRHQFRESDIVKNRASKIDGAGLNVNACIETMARMQGIKQLEGFLDWSADFSGGSWPERLGEQLNQYRAKVAYVPSVPLYVHVEGRFSEALEFVQKCITSGPVMISYSGGPKSRYKATVWTCVVVLDYSACGDQVCFFDPNFTARGERYQWASLSDFREQVKGPYERKIWAVTLNPELTLTGVDR